MEAPNGVFYVNESGQLVVRSGLKVLVAKGRTYGSGGGDLNNEERTLTSDIVASFTNPYSYPVRWCVFLNCATTPFSLVTGYDYTAYTIGRQQPSTYFDGYAVWYDTSDNKVKVTTNSGTNWTDTDFVFLGEVAMLANQTGITNANVDFMEPVTIYDSSMNPYLSRICLPNILDGYINIGYSNSGETYTAPANGWVYADIQLSANGGYVCIDSEDSNLPSGSKSMMSGRAEGVAGGRATVVFPVVKGQKFIVKYAYAEPNYTNVLRFIYADGEVN